MYCWDHNKDHRREGEDAYRYRNYSEKREWDWNKHESDCARERLAGWAEAERREYDERMMEERQEEERQEENTRRIMQEECERMEYEQMVEEQYRQEQQAESEAEDET